MKSWSQKRAILSASSVLAVVAALGGNAWACGTMSGDFAFFSNTGPLDCLNFSNATVQGSVSNTSTGTIGPPRSPAPATVVINNTTIGGTLQNSGTISASGGTPGGISVAGGSVIGGGIVNNSTGTISVSGSGPNAFGIQISQSSFSGGITNNGVIVVTNSSGSSAGLQIGAGSSSGPAPINQGSVTGPTVTTSGTTTFGHNRRH